MSEYTIKPTIEKIDISKVAPGRFQPRLGFDAQSLAMLAASIQEHGQIDPALVWKNSEGMWELVAGERRFRAICALRLDQVNDHQDLAACAAKCAQQSPRTIGDFVDWAAGALILARVVEADDPAVLFELALVDNLDRDNLSTLEEAHALRQLQSARNISQAQVAERIGRSQSYVAQRLGLLKLDSKALEILQAGPGGLSLSQARHVGRLPNDYQVDLADYLIDIGPTDRDANDIVALLLKLVEIPDLRRSDITGKFKSPWGQRENRPAPELKRELGALWDRSTRDLSKGAWEGPWGPPRFPLDWNPRNDDTITLALADENLLPNPAACDFCQLSHGPENARRCLKPLCFDRKQTLWGDHTRAMEPPEAEPSPTAPAAPDYYARNNQPAAPAPTPSPKERHPDRSGGISAPSPTPAPAPAAPPKPLPVMQPVEQPRPVRITAIIEPGEELAQRLVLVTIGEDGRVPKLYRGDYGDLTTLVETACDEFFNRDDQPMATAELEDAIEV